MRADELVYQISNLECGARHYFVPVHVRARRDSSRYTTRHAPRGVRMHPYLRGGAHTRGFEDGPAFRRA